jgi:hypothetical protein
VGVRRRRAEGCRARNFLPGDELVADDVVVDDEDLAVGVVSVVLGGPAAARGARRLAPVGAVSIVLGIL